MSGARFTPGPWEAVRHPETGDFSLHYNSDYEGYGPSFLEGGLTQPDDAENAANARLIAAAPDGYAIADRLIAHLREDFRIPSDADEGWIVDTLGHGLGGIYLDALTFLAKARGETA